MHGPADKRAMPLGGTNAEALQRLQIGAAGIVVMLLLVTLADVITERADRAEAEAVPEAAATVAPEPTEAPQSDPLVDAGVVPDLPAETAEEPEQEAAILPEQGPATETE